MDFIKTKSGYDIIENNEKVGIIYKDESKNYLFQIVAKLNFEIKGYRNQRAAKTWKQVKKDIEQTYNELIRVNKVTGQEIIKLSSL